MKVKTSKGFTLAELLIVMAIIVMLAAVAVPTFAKQLETSRETTDIETIRNAYTDAYTSAMQDVAADGKLNTTDVVVDSLTFIQAKAGFDYISAKIAGASLPANVVANATAGKTDKLTFTFAQNEDGSISLSTITFAAGT